MGLMKLRLKLLGNMKKLFYLILAFSLVSCEHTTTTTTIEKKWDEETQDTVITEKTVITKEYNESDAVNGAANVIQATGLLIGCASLWRE